MKQSIKAEPAYDNAQEIQQQASAMQLLVSAGALVEVVTRSNSITSIVNHAAFFHSTAKATARLLLYRTMACLSLHLSFLLLLSPPPRLSLIIIVKSSTLTTTMAMLMMTQLHGCAVVKVYLRAVAW
jgi:hypothetical protein